VPSDDRPTNRHGNDLSILPCAALTVSSREIAELTGKEHRNVLRDARAMLTELHGAGGVLSFEQTYRDPQNGQTYPAVMLPQRESLILVSGYSVAMRARIVDRWQELEAERTKPAPVALTLPDYPAALRASADATDRRLALAVDVWRLTHIDITKTALIAVTLNRLATRAKFPTLKLSTGFRGLGLAPSN
jgi:phage regulator Rha-like protein